jgi:hypothetical protein
MQSRSHTCMRHARSRPCVCACALHACADTSARRHAHTSCCLSLQRHRAIACRITSNEFAATSPSSRQHTNERSSDHGNHGDVHSRHARSTRDVGNFHGVRAGPRAHASRFPTSPRQVLGHLSDRRVSEGTRHAVMLHLSDATPHPCTRNVICTVAWEPAQSNPRSP